jgi:hypothetical protein
MPAPTLDRKPETTQAGTSAGHRRPRRQLVLVAIALLVLAVAVGTSLAIATRPVATQAPAEAGVAPAAPAGGQNVNADQNGATGQGTTAQPDQGNPAGTPTKASNPGSTGSDGAGLALPDGDHDAYITSIDRVNNRIVVDVVQVFHDKQAVTEAIADGKSRSEAQYLTTWVRNENPRLRTLPLASGLVVKLWGSCEEGGGHNLLTTLSANARQKGLYYYTLTLAGGKVQRIQERLAINAC